MFVFSCSIDVRPEIKEKIRAEIDELVNICNVVGIELNELQPARTGKMEAQRDNA